MTLSAELVVRAKSFALDVAFDIPPGVTVLFGPSGSGKTSTLGCLAGIARPDSGRIALGDDVWFDSKKGIELPIHERRVAYVFQSLALFPHMSAAENVAYGLDRKLAKAERYTRACEILERMRVRHLADRRPRTFSGGEAQRVALARAFAMTPRLLLLDEPFSALDAATKNELLGEVASWVEREKIPTILVTHHPEEARALGQRVILLDKGRITSSGTIDEVSLSVSKMKAAPP
ncbi:MAG TPA: ATP-binding cassette domain-containing protein [Labilithrix sp.]|jgi:molybdate transport system ATP-binding protein